MFTTTTPQEQKKLENVGKGLCPTCQGKLSKIDQEMCCEKCPFTIPFSMYDQIVKQYGKKDGN